MGHGPAIGPLKKNCVQIIFVASVKDYDTPAEPN